MGRKNTAVFIIFILLATILTGVYAETQYLPQLKESSYVKEVNSLFDKVQSDVSRLRGFPAPNGVKVEVVSIEFFKSGATQASGENPILKAQEALYKGLLVVPENFSLIEKKVNEAGMTLSATSGKTLYIVREYFDPNDRKSALRTLAHEYTHILQYVYLEQRAPKTQDELLAWNAFIEGEADLVADLYISNVTGDPFSYRIPPTPMTMPKVAGGGGWALDQTFSFPYSYGENFVYELYRKGGWDEVNKAYHHVPTSTAQILNIDEYLGGLEPISFLNPKPLNNQWSIYYQDSLGEYFMRTMLLENLEPNLAVNSTSGWVGDNLTLYLNEKAYLILWGSMWRDENSASNFGKALLAFLQHKGCVEMNGTVWDLSGRLFVVECVGKTVMLICSSDLDVLTQEVNSKFNEFNSSS
jgi:hypothetical protein